jgi:Tol biopolymer transport system component
VTEFWGNGEIVRMSGTHFYRLTEDNFSDSYPSFSPDGLWIAFSSNRIDSQFDIFRMPYDGGDPTRITTDESVEIDPYYGGAP